MIQVLIPRFRVTDDKFPETNDVYLLLVYGFFYVVHDVVTDSVVKCHHGMCTLLPLIH